MRWSLAALVVLLASTHTTDAPAVEARGFAIVRRAQPPGPVRATDGWDLYDLFHRAYVDVRPQGGAIELVTRRDPAGLVTFKNRAGSNELRCGDIVALAVQGAWLQYDPTKRDLQVTPVVNDQPELGPALFQWRIGCKPGEPLVTGRPIALFNLVAMDTLVGCRRVWGAPFCWDDRQLMGLAKD